jgi:hypothetical protein
MTPTTVGFYEKAGVQMYDATNYTLL